jgi:hypothetical protein
MSFVGDYSRNRPGNRCVSGEVFSIFDATRQKRDLRNLRIIKNLWMSGTPEATPKLSRWKHK